MSAKRLEICYDDSLLDVIDKLEKFLPEFGLKVKVDHEGEEETSVYLEVDHA